MRYDEVYRALHRQPFQPFRIQLSNGQSHVIRHPDFGWVTRTALHVGHPSGKDEIPDRVTECDLLHIVAIEPVNGTSRDGRSHRGRKRE